MQNNLIMLSFRALLNKFVLLLYIKRAKKGNSIGFLSNSRYHITRNWFLPHLTLKFSSDFLCVTKSLTIKYRVNLKLYRCYFLLLLHFLLIFYDFKTAFLTFMIYKMNI